MIGKWLDELEKKGAIYEYNIAFDDITQEYIVNYYVPIKPIPYIVMEFTVDPITKEIVFKEETHESC
jgi:hypothetical protein